LKQQNLVLPGKLSVGWVQCRPRIIQWQNGPLEAEFLISYKERSSSLALINKKSTVSDNGIFHPTIVVNGQVEGLWKRTIQKNKVIIEMNLFQKSDLQVRKQIEKKACIFGQFLEKEIEIIQKTKT
jgi:hypothetical protein